MVVKAPPQQIDQSGVFVLFKDDLVQKLFGKNLFIFSRKREDFWQTFDNHGANFIRCARLLQ